MARLLLSSCLVISAVAQDTYRGKATYPLNQTCSATTCAASFCTTTNSMRGCVFTNTVTIDFQKELNKAQCQQCTQDLSDTRCSSTALSAVIPKGSGVKAAYCNDKFLVVFSDASPGFTPNLDGIPNPPGGSDANGQCVTRSWWAGFKMTKIPLSSKYTLLPTANRYNNADNASFPGGPGENGYLNSATRGTYGLPTRGEVGITVAGQSIYPVFNNRAELTPEACEVDRCNEHVGQGGGAPHLHGDPFGCLYSAANYSSLDAHPPQIGWSLDGPNIFGRYLSTAAPGYSAALDDCGGHQHDSYGYHYHSQVKSAASDEGCVEKSVAVGTEYPAFPPGVDQCWRANISAIPGFWGGQAVDSYTKPCCGMTDYYLAPGYTLPTTAGPPSPPGPGASSTTGPPAPANSSMLSSSPTALSPQRMLMATILLSLLV